MTYPLYTYSMVLVVSGQDTLCDVCENLENIGFTVKEPSSLRDVSQAIAGYAVPSAQSVSPVNSDSFSEEFIHMLQSTLSKISSIIVTLEDLSQMKICNNDTHISPAYQPTLSEVEREYIIATLDKCGWRCKTAAKLLGINRSTIYRKMKKYGIRKVKV